MTLDEIAKAAATFSLDPDECRILAAACKVAADYASGAGTPTENPFEVLAGSDETPYGKQASFLFGPLLEGYAAFLEAAGMAAYLHDNFTNTPKRREEYSLSGLRKGGTGWHFPYRVKDEADDDLR